MADCSKLRGFHAGALFSYREESLPIYRQDTPQCCNNDGRWRLSNAYTRSCSSNRHVGLVRARTESISEL